MPVRLILLGYKGEKISLWCVEADYLVVKTILLIYMEKHSDSDEIECWDSTKSPARKSNLHFRLAKNLFHSTANSPIKFFFFRSKPTFKSFFLLFPLPSHNFNDIKEGELNA